MKCRGKRIILLIIPILMFMATTAFPAAAETVWTYPPGVPLLLPGEQVPEGLPELLASLTVRGVRVRKNRSAERNEIQCAIVSAYR